MLRRGLLLFLLLCIAFVTPGFSYTDPGDVAALKTLKQQWKNVPRNWKNSDPCGDKWDGIICNNSRVTNLTLFSMDIEGTLGKEIGDLTQLQLLHLSSNLKLGGTLPGTLGNLIHLSSLKLDSCSFSGEIPAALGNLANLRFLALNSNKFTGKIPPLLGKLSQLWWLDLADNQLTGPLPILTTDDWGLDQLLNAEHLLLDRNQLVGSIPTSIGLVNTLEVIRLDNNYLMGSVPSFNNLTKLNFLNLANNSLAGSLPNLTMLTSLTYLDLSNNQFDRSEAPAWLSNLQKLTTLTIESGQLYGQLPQDIFSFQDLQEVRLKNNSLNGTFVMGNKVTKNLQMVNLEFNSITSVTLTSVYSKNIMLMGNPVCSIPHLNTTAYCTDVVDPNQIYVNPSNCSNPFSVDLVLRAPYFSYAPQEYIKDLKETLNDKLNNCTPRVRLDCARISVKIVLFELVVRNSGYFCYPE